MGILKPQAGLYYDNLNPDYGSYQRISLQEVIDSFNATYVGHGKICEGALINDVAFHAIRGLQELSYDTLRSEKDWELIVPSTLAIVLPIDYVNYVKVSWSDSNGVQRILYPTSKTSNPLDITTLPLAGGGDSTSPTPQLGDGFDTGGAGNDLTTDVSDLSDNNAGNYSDTNANFMAQTAADIGSTNADSIDDEYGSLLGGRYGIDPQYAQHNGTFFIDEDQGKIHFSSNVSGKTLVLKYISDGLFSAAGGSSISLTDSYVHKFAEEAIYKHILYGLLLARAGTPAGLLAQIKKERFAETRNAKIRLSNYKSEEMAQTMRGSSKIIKH